MTTNTPITAHKVPYLELVAFTAAIMAVNALAIDMILPALGIIGDELSITNDNDRQLIIFAFVLGNGVAQLFFGPLVDRFGRRRILLIAMAGYLAGSVLSIFAGSFALLLAARIFQGIATAGARVASIAIVRDQYSGRKMAEVMSLAVTVFMMAPIVAPAIGQIILSFSPWRAIFAVLLVYGVVISIWGMARIPETLRQDAVKPLKPANIIASYTEFLTNRQAMGYTVGSALVFSGLFGYIGASEQIFLEVYHLGHLFSIAFAIVAVALAGATFANARLVGRFGMRRLTHGAVIAYGVASGIHLLLASTLGASLPMFIFFTSIVFFAIGLIGPNCTALSMEPMGHMAGAASAANGFAGTTIAALVGGLVARSFDGTPVPIIAGFFYLGLAAIAVMLWTERGRLFQAQNDDPKAPETAAEAEARQP